MREAELKHCRVAMLATLGLVAQEAGVVFPGNVSQIYHTMESPKLIMYLMYFGLANRIKLYRCLLDCRGAQPCCHRLCLPFPWHSRRYSLNNDRSIRTASSICSSDMFAVLFCSSVFSGIAITEGRKSGDRAPGEFGFNPLKFGTTDASKKDLALKEVRNGRLAMWAAAGILFQEAFTSKGALEAIF